ncbi:MAG: BrnA antitoxin family protein [Thermoanaerobaculia bacterium]|nr:BrnA antitoxin family protein [Thermoanaerobaculia bacterium]
MTANKTRLRLTSKTNLARVDAHITQPSEYEELPELSEEMLARAVVHKGGRPRSPNPRKLITLRLPADVIERWRATGPGWQTRMAERLSRGPAAGVKRRAG